MVIWLRMPRWLCYWGIFRRIMRYRGRTRPEMAPGCPEPWFDGEFLRYIWEFETRYSPAITANLEKYGPELPLLTLKSRDQVRTLLDLAGAPA